MFNTIKKLFSSNNNINETEKSLNLSSIKEEDLISYNPLPEINEPYFEVISVSPNIYLAHRGARICIGKGPIDGSLREQAKHISKVLAKQHESIMEHTSVIGLFHIPLNETAHSSYISYHPEDYTEFLSCLKYCNFIVSRTKSDNELLILIGGSIRAYIHALRESSINNYYTNILLKPFMTSTIEKEFLMEMINLNLLDESDCTYITDSDIDREADMIEADSIYEPSEINNGSRVILVYKNNPLQIYTHNDTISKYFTIKDLYKVCTISYIFYNISRSCANQITRHRNAISQESQRYVTKVYTEHDFIDPIQLNIDDRYSNIQLNTIYSYIPMNPSKIYNDLLKNTSVNKEDARAWLPMNIKTQLMVTFTYENFGKFLKLRLDNHAQKEIRLLSEEASKFIFTDNPSLINFINATTSFGFESSIENEQSIQLNDEDIDDQIQSLDISNDDEADALLKKSEELKRLEE